MKSTRLLQRLVGAVLLFAAVSSEAQPQLAYVNRVFAPGYNLMANPLQTGSNHLSEVMPVAPAGTRLHKFNNQTQTYEPVQTFVHGLGWVPGNMTLNPGEGAFLYAPTQFVATFLGYGLEDQSRPNVPPGTCSLFSSRTPQAAPFSALFSLPPQEEDVVYLWDAPSQNFLAFFYFGFGLWEPSEPVIPLGEALWLCHHGPGPTLPGASSPMITSQPTSVRVNVGSRADFAVGFTGAPPFTVSWERGLMTVATFTFNNAGLSTFALNSVQPADAGFYTAVVRNAAGAVTSDPADLRVNGAPVLQPVSNLVVRAGTVAVVQLQVVDPDSPPGALVFSLESGPPGAQVDPATGFFFWETTAADAGTTHSVTVSVSDDGQPPLRDTMTLTIVVSPELQIVDITRASRAVTITWLSIPGFVYRVLYRDSLEETNWHELPGDVTATGTTTSKTDDTVTGSDSRYYSVTTTTTITRPAFCLLDDNLRRGLAITLDIIAPAAGSTTHRQNEKIPLIVHSTDIDQVLHNCVCIRYPRPCSEARVFNVMDSVNYQWKIVAGEGALEGVGPAVLYRPPNLQTGETKKVTIRVDVTDSYGNDPAPRAEFFIEMKRPGECEYRRTIGRARATYPDAIITPTGQCECKPKPETWLAVPFPMRALAPPDLKMCVGERRVLEATGLDFDLLLMECESEGCGLPFVWRFAFDEVNYSWSAMKGTFPDHGAAPKSNSRKTSVIYKASDTPGEDTVTIQVDDSKRQGIDPQLTRTVKIKAFKVDLAADGVAEDDEECIGGFLCHNRDDDNANGTLDKDETGKVDNENDLLRITLTKEPKEGNVILKATMGAGKIKVWEKKTKEKEVPLPATFAASKLPLDLWVEGFAPSDKPRDIELTLESDDPKCEDKVRLTVLICDIDMDTDRDGTVEDADDEKDEEKWTKGPNTRGTLVLPNADKDNAVANGAPDNWIGGDWDFDGTVTSPREDANRKVDADPDKDDLARLWLHKLGVDPLPDDVTATLEVFKVAGENAYFASVDAHKRLRVFLPSEVSGNDLVIKAGDDSIIGPEAGAKVEFVKAPSGAAQKPIALLKGQGILKCGVEGIEFGALADLVLVVKVGGKEVCRDTNRLCVSPWVLYNHFFDVNTGTGMRNTAYIEDLAADNADVRTALKAMTGAADVDETSIGDVWHQDGYEVSYVKAPYGEMPVVLVSPRGVARSAALATYVHTKLLNKGVGVCTRIEGLVGIDTYDSCGNLESRPGKSEPGTFFHGRSMHNDFEAFINAQDVNMDKPVNTDWLSVGHVDEVVSFSSDAKHVLIADPEVCWGLLLWAQQVDGTAVMQQDMAPHGAGGVTVADVIAGAGGVPAYVRDYNVESAGVDAHVMRPANLPDIRAKLNLAANEPESVPAAGGGNTGGTRLTKGGAFVGFFPGARKRHFRITYTAAAVYKLEFKEDGAGAWTLDRACANRANDEVFTNALCFVLRNWWDASGGAPAVGDTFEFAADPGSEVIEMPVLFIKTRDKTGGFSSEAGNYSNNHVNCVVHGTKVLTSKSWGPNVNYDGTGARNILDDYVRRMFLLAGYTTVSTADDRYYSNRCGSLHCGTNVERKVPSYKWWEK